MQLFTLYHLPTILHSMALLQQTKLSSLHRAELTGNHPDVHAVQNLSVCPTVQI